jgi:acyl carrier protein
MTISSIESQIRQNLAKLLGREPESLPLEQSFFELGVDSMVGMRLIGKVADSTGLEIEPVAVFDHPNIREFARYLYGRLST